MSRFVSNRNSDGLTDENGHFRLPLKFVDGEILSGFELKAQSSPSMEITITAGDAKIPYSDYSYAVWSDADETVTIPTSSGVAPRIDKVVAYVDRAMTFTSSSVNHPDCLKFMVVSGTANNNPVAPTDAQVQSAVGAGNPFITLGQVRVPMGATIITSSNVENAGRKTMTLSNSVKAQTVSTTDGSKIQFAIIQDGQSLPSAIPDTNLVVLVMKG